MTTTVLIELLQMLEKGASGRSREISFMFKLKNDSEEFLHEPNIRFHSSGDGVAGAELTLFVCQTEQK